VAVAKKPGKAMDVVHTENTPPETTSRPVLVTNRPFMKIDPMLTPDDVGAAADGEKPSGEATSPSGVPPIAHTTKGTVPPPATASDTNQSTGADAATEPEAAVQEAEVTETAGASQDSTAAAVSTTGTVDAAKPMPATDAPQDSALQEQSVTRDTPKQRLGEPTRSTPVSATAAEPEAPLQPPSKTKKVFAPISSGATEDQSTPSDETSAEQDAQLSPPETVNADAHRAELEQHIAAGTYVVPIGQLKRRRRKILLVVLALCLLAILTLDLLLDAGILTLPAVPHTTFLR
jgi:hypothetical protein